MDKVIIVSDPLHMKRAMLMAKDYGQKCVHFTHAVNNVSNFKVENPVFGAGNILLYRL